MAKEQSVIPITRVEQKILTLRGEQVIVDADLAELYGVTTKALNQAVKRNADRFPRGLCVSAQCSRERRGGHKL
ncbi:MAG: hypothetical protein ICCCNLDF_01065 [Planctomycetes bacterium]|nr:hypothetical protein [Planctomycetota bacterium]